MRKNFYLTMLTEFCRLMEETRIKNEEEQKAKERNYGHTWTEGHKWYLAYEEIKPKKRNNQFVRY